MGELRQVRALIQSEKGLNTVTMLETDVEGNDHSF